MATIAFLHLLKNTLYTYFMLINKQKIKESCLSHLNTSIKMLEETIAETQLAANSNNKSSAGDKHETARAMAQLEKERLTKQLANLFLLKRQLNNISIEQNTGKIRIGSCIVTSQNTFFLAVGLGKIIYLTHFFYCISPNSPIGKSLLHKTVGDTFVLGNKEVKIEAIY